MTTDLNYDGLAEAEKVTGKSYKEDEDTMALGFALSVLSNERKARELKMADDTHHGSPFPETLRVFADLGFEEVWSNTFIAKANYAGDSDRQDVHKLLWREDGVLAHVESYSGFEVNSTNSAKIYYNWRISDEIKEEGEYYRYTSSGHFHRESYDAGEFIYIGDHDVREGLRQKLGNLETYGSFVNPWKEQQFIWFLNYAQTREAEKFSAYAEKTEWYNEINRKVISELPQNVRDAIGPYKR